MKTKTLRVNILKHTGAICHICPLWVLISLTPSQWETGPGQIGGAKASLAQNPVRTTVPFRGQITRIPILLGLQPRFGGQITRKGLQSYRKRFNLTLSGLQSRFGDKPLGTSVAYPSSGTAVLLLKGSCVFSSCKCAGRSVKASHRGLLAYLTGRWVSVSPCLFNLNILARV